MKYGRVRRDANHKEIVAALRRIGASVTDLSAVGSGVPDVLVGYRGRNFLLEIKNPKHRRKSGSTNPTTGEKQAQWRMTWNGSVSVVETFTEAVAAVSGGKAGPLVSAI